MRDPTSPADAENLCGLCPQADICLSANLDENELRHFHTAILQQKAVQKGEFLFHLGDAFEGLLIVRSGSFKSTIIDHDGREHVLHFHFPREIIGFDAIYLGRHISSAVALVESSICCLSFTQILQGAEHMPEIQMRLFRLFSQYVLRTGCMTGAYTAEERVAAFLLSMANRLGQPGTRTEEIELVMSREDIANHLRLASETVSRIFGRLRDESIIAVKGKRIALLQIDPLLELSSSLGRRFTN